MTTPPNQSWPSQHQQPYGQPQYAPPPKKRKVWPWVVLGLVVLLFGGCFAAVGTASKKVSQAVDAATTSIQSAANAPAPLGGKGKTKTVLYEVTSPSGSANSITYFGSDNGQQQETQADLPWSKQVVNDSTFAIVGVTAQNGGTGDITCRITVDGTVKTEQTSKGKYAVVSCTATG
ncbi:MmpS family transport accessory protein [Nocardia sp. NPDC004711]